MPNEVHPEYLRWLSENSKRQDLVIQLMKEKETRKNSEENLRMQAETYESLRETWDRREGRLKTWIVVWQTVAIVALVAGFFLRKYLVSGG